MININDNIICLYIDVLYFNRSIKQEGFIISTKRYFVDNYESVYHYLIDYNRIYHIKSERKIRKRRNEY